MGSRACSIDRLDVAHLVTRNSRHCCWPVPKKFINCKEAQEALQEEKFLWDIRQEAFRTTCRQLFFSPQNPNNKMRAKKPGTCNYHQLGVWSVCTMLVCVHTKREREWEKRRKEWFRVPQNEQKCCSSWEAFFVCLCQVENLLDFLGSEQKFPKNDLFNE